LSHVQGHVFFKSNLWYFNEFNEETHPEKEDKENPKELTRPGMAIVFTINPTGDQKNG
jgi:hypothetical protein